MVSNKFAANTVWTGDVRNSFNKVLDHVGTSWSSGVPLEPFDFSAGHITGYGKATYYGLVKELQLLVASVGRPSLLSLSDQIEALLRKYESEHVVVLSTVTPTFNTLKCEIEFVRLSNVYAVSAIWDSYFDSSLLELPLFLETKLTFRLTADPEATTVDITAKGNLELRDWAAPFMDGMDPGMIGNSVARVEIDLPRDATLTFSFDAFVKAFGKVSVSIKAAKLLTNDAITTATFNGQPVRQQKVVSPRTMLGAVAATTRLLPAGLAGPLNFTMPIVGNMLSAATVESWLATVTPWTSIYAIYYARIFKTNELCPSFPQTVIGISVNGGNMTNCTLKGNNYADIPSLAQGLNRDIANCGFGNFLAIKFDGNNDEKPECGYVGFFPAVPGALVALELEAPTLFGTPTKWVGVIGPSFGTWDDFSWLSFFAFRNAVGSPKFVTPITLEDVKDFPLVPTELREVFPPKLPALSLNFGFAHDNKVTNFMNREGGLQFMNKSIVVECNVASTGKITTNLEMDYVIALTGIPTADNFGVYSDLPGGLKVDSPIPASAAKSFSFRVMGQRRSFDTVEDFDIERTVTLTAGESILNGLSKAILNAVPENIRPMVNVAKIEYEAITEVPPQIRIFCKRVKVGDMWLIPWMMGVTASEVPFLRVSNLEPSRGLFLVSNFTSTISFNMDPTVRKANGTLGFLHFESDSVKAHSVTTVQVKEKEKLTYLSAISAVMPARTSFFEKLYLSMSMDASLEVSSLTFPGHVLAIPPSHSFKAKTNVVSLNIGNLTALDGVRGSFWLDVNKADLSPSVRTMAGLTNSNFCDIIQEIEALATAIRTMPGANQKLPLTSDSVNDILKMTIDEPLKRVDSAICKGATAYTVATFCARLNTTFLSDKAPCSKLTIGAESLSLPIDLTVKFNKETTFAFDTKAFFDGNLPVGLGPAKGMMLTGSTKIKGNFVIKFIDGKVRFAMDPGSLVGLYPEYKLSTTMRADIGALSITFSGVKGSLDSTAIEAKLKPDYKVDVTVKGKSKMIADVRFPGIDLCVITIEVTDLAPFLVGTTDPGILVVKTDCSSGAEFIGLLTSVFDDLSLYGLLSNSPAIINYMRKELKQYTDVVFGSSGALRKLEVPLLGSKVKFGLVSELSQLTSPDFFKTWSEMVDDASKRVASPIVERNGTRLPTSKEKDDMMLEEYTQIICDMFRIEACPGTPSASSDGVFKWPLALDISYEIELNNFGFPFSGGSVGASFEVPTMVVLFKAGIFFDLEFSKSKGMALSWNTEKIMEISVALDVDDLQLRGRLGFLGLQFAADLKLAFGVKLTKGWKTSAYFQAQLTGDADLGLVGDKPDGTPDYTGLPRFKAGFTFGWGDEPITINKALPKPSFEVTKIGFCFGTLIGGPVLRFARDVVDWLKPLNDYIGPRGFLQKEVPGTEQIFGRRLKVIHVLKELATTLCDEGCKWDGVFDLLQTYADVIAQVEIFADIAKNPDGCLVMAPSQAFKLSLKHDWPVVNMSGIGMPPDGLAGKPGDVKVAKDAFAKLEGKFGFNLLIHKDIPQKLVALIMGQPIEIISVTFPVLRIGAMVQFDIPIWAGLYLHIEAAAAVTIDIGELVFTSKGITDAIKTGEPEALVNSLALRVKNRDGSPHYPVVLSLRLGAGLRLDLALLDVSLTISFEITAKFRFVTLHGDALMTFGELIYQLDQVDGNILAIMEKRLTGTITISFRIRVCVPLIFKKVCFTVLRLDFSFVIFDIIIKPSFQPKPLYLPSGVLDVGVINKAKRPPTKRAIMEGQMLLDSQAAPSRLVTIYDSEKAGDVTVDFVIDGSEPLSRTLVPPGPLTFQGSANVAYTLSILKLVEQVILPAASGRTTTLEIHQSAIDDATKYVVNPRIVRTDKTLGVNLEASCSLLNMTSPSSGMLVEVAGVPCTSVIESDEGTLLLEGEPALYAGKPVTLTGTTQKIEAAVLSTSYDIHDTKIIGAGGFDFRFPQSPTVHVKGHPLKDNNFTLNSVFSDLTVSGGEGNDDFSIPNFSLLNGVPLLSGGGGLNSWSIRLDGRNGADTTLRGTSLVQKDETGSQKIAQWSNIQQMNLEYIAAESGPTSLNILPVPTDSLVQVTMVGNPQATIEQTVKGCQNKAELRIYLKSGGSNNIILSSDTLDISSFRCTVRVYGNSGADSAMDTITIFAPQESKSTSWTWDSETLTVRDLLNKGNWFQLIYQEIEFVNVTYGLGGSTVDFARGAAGSEYQFQFPGPKLIPNTVNVFGTSGSLLLLGNISKVQLAPKPDPLTPIIPFDILRGFVGLKSTIPVDVSIASGREVPSQYMTVDSGCINQVTKDSVLVPRPNKPTGWMCSILKNHFSATACGCSFAYKGTIRNLAITTGGSPDGITARDLKLSGYFSVDMNDGDNNFYLTSSSMDSSLSISSGTGADKLAVNKVEILGAFTVNPGAGDDLLTVDDILAASLTINDVSGADGFTLKNAGIKAGASITNDGPGSDKIEATLLSVKKSFTISDVGEGNDSYRGVGVTVGESFTVSLGRGSDTFSAKGGSVLGSLIVDLADGDNIFEAIDNAMVLGPVVVTLGEGKDSTLFTGVFGSVTINDARGSDTYAVRSATVRSTYLVNDKGMEGESITFNNFTAQTSITINAAGDGSDTFKSDGVIVGQSYTVNLGNGNGNDVVTMTGGNVGTNFKADLGDGLNSFTVTGGRVIGDFIVDMGDSVDTFTASAGTVIGSMALSLGGAGDQVTITNHAIGSLSIDTSDGDDKVNVRRGTIGSITIADPSGSDSYSFTDGTVLAVVTIDDADGLDTYAVSNMMVRGNFAISDSGNGKDTFTISNSVVRQQFSISALGSGGDTLTAVDSTVSGSFIVDLADDADIVTATNCSIGNLFKVDLGTGNGADIFTAVGGKMGILDVITGADKDIFSLSKTHLQTLLLDMGDGKDTATISQVQNGNATIVMGFESDVLNFVTPVGDMDVWLGNLLDHDNSIDSVYINSTFDTALSHKPDGTLAAAPVGPAGEEIVFHDFDIEDLMYINDKAKESGDNNTHVKIEVAGIVNKDMLSNTTYDVTACDLQGTLVLNGLADLTNPSSAVTAFNWKVIVQLPHYNSACLIRIYSAPAANGYLSILLPSGEQIYSVSTSTFEPQEKFGLTRAGALSIETLSVATIEVRTQGAIEMSVDGTPSNAELVVRASLPSTLEVTKLDGNLISSNFNVSLPHPGYLPAVTVVTTGTRTFTKFNGIKEEDENKRASQFTDISSVTYDNGCITVKPTAGASRPSARFMKQLQEYSLPATSVSCLAYTHNIRGLSLNVLPTTKVIVSGLTRNAPQMEFIGGVVTLNDPVKWTNATINKRVLTVDGQRYQVTLQGSELRVPDLVLTSITKLRVTCNVNQPFANWYIGVDGKTTTGVYWDGLSSLGTLRFPLNSVPSITLDGEGIDASVELAAKGSAKFVPSTLEEVTVLSLTATTLSMQGKGNLIVTQLDLWGNGTIDVNGYNNVDSLFSMEPSTIVSKGLKNVNLKHNGPLTKVQGSFASAAELSVRVDTGVCNFIHVLEVSASFMHAGDLITCAGIGGEAAIVILDATKGMASLQDVTSFKTTNSRTKSSIQTTSSPSSAIVNYATGESNFAGLYTFNGVINATVGVLKIDSRSAEPVSVQANFKTSRVAFEGTDALSVDFNGKQGRFKFDSTHHGEDSSSQVTPEAGTAFLQGVDSLKGDFETEQRARMVFDADTAYSTAMLEIKDGKLDLSSVLRLDCSATSSLGNMNVTATDDEAFPATIVTETGLVSIPRADDLSVAFQSKEILFGIRTSTAHGPISAVSIVELSTGKVSVQSIRSLDYSLTQRVTNKKLSVKATGNSMVFLANLYGATTNITYASEASLTKVLPDAHTLDVTTRANADASMQLLSSPTGDLILDAIFVEAKSKTETETLSLTSNGKISLVNITSNSTLELRGEASVSGVKTTKEGRLAVTSLQPTTGKLILSGNHLVLSQVLELDFNATLTTVGVVGVNGYGKYLTADVDMSTGAMNFGGKGNVDVEMDLSFDTTWKRADVTTGRNITVHQHNITVTGPHPVVIQQANASEITVTITSLVLSLRDGINEVYVTGSLLPIINIDKTVETLVHAHSSDHILTFPNRQYHFNVEDLALVLSEEDGTSCVQPKVACSLGAWASLTGGNLTDAPCHSNFYNTLCEIKSSIQINYIGQVQCISTSLETEGWSVSTTVDSVKEYEGIFRVSLKGFMIFVYFWSLLVLVLGWVFFGAILLEGWSAFAITAFLWKATPESSDISTLALNIVYQAYYVFVGWFTGNHCSITQMRGGWALIGLTLIILLLLILERQKFIAKSTISDVLKRFFTVMGLFFLAPTALAHLPLDGSSTGVLIATVLIICTSALMFAFGHESFEVPAWIISRNDATHSFAVWAPFPLAFVTMFFLLLAIITPGSCLHWQVQEHILVVVVILVLMFTTFTLVKEFVILRRMYYFCLQTRN